MIDATAIAAARRRLPAAFGPSTGALVGRGVVGALVVAWLVASLVWFDVTPGRLLRGAGGLLTIVRLMLPPSPGAQWRDILQGLGQSVAMAFLATSLAAAVALPLGLLGARNVVVNALAHFTLRRVFDGLRGIDQLIWALAFVRAVGLGPLAGTMALFAAEVAVLAKLFAEAIETADPRASEAIRAVGGSRLMVVRFAILPHVAPLVLTQALYAFESNTRAAAVLGVVGAGGIGLQIAERIKVRYWDQVAFIILLLMATVALIDFASSRLRRRLIDGGGPSAPISRLHNDGGLPR